MTSPSPEQEYADRRYRSPAGIAGGVLMLALAGWLGGDAAVRGEGSTPWLALAGLLCVVPLIIAFTLRPAVFAGASRLLVRNPFRTITLPWGAVDAVRAGYSSEVLAGGSTYQLWAVPVSLRKRKRAARGGAAEAAPADQTVAELQELAERNASREDAQGDVVVRWAYEVLAPAGVGLVLFVVLLVVG
ncbi:PH domain-containing protein [Streptomyces telluris]|uniref:PH domain-containing protein n=1 Tax=Streptomyces telluris TaxID=2720021 RepID=A0A9X2RK23_9ACTN|nr:PH domain-containing protein [Streptomyces telluris]MCQ8769378.1 PH domain-containing protein [Streptomyces telluris]NJP80263.1 PH domain-containing protein [Streptomyces telluris]